MLDVNALLSPVSGEHPSGENLEYEPEFRDLEQAAVGKAEQVMGSSTIAAEPPNFPELEGQVISLLGRSKDLRIAVHGARATLALDGFVGLQSGLELVSRLLSDFWETIHPELDEDDDNDPIMRISALSGLVSSDFLLAVRSAPLAEDKFGSLTSLRHHAVAAGELPQPVEGPKVEERGLDAIYRAEASAVAEERMGAIDASRSHIKAIGAAFRASCGQPGPDLSALDSLLHRAQAVLRSKQSSVPEAKKGSGEGAEKEQSPATGAAEVSLAASQVRSRKDVMLLLDKICDYYDSYEPSSPLPLLLRRCQRLCELSFKEIIKDLTPAAVKELDIIAGKLPGETKGAKK